MKIDYLNKYFTIPDTEFNLEWILIHAEEIIYHPLLSPDIDILCKIKSILIEKRIESFILNDPAETIIARRIDYGKVIEINIPFSEFFNSNRNQFYHKQKCLFFVQKSDLVIAQKTMEVFKKTLIEPEVELDDF